MQLSDILNQTGGLQSIAREFGISEDEASRAASALGPAVLGGMRRQAESHPQGLSGLGGLLNQLGGSGMLDEVLAPRATDTSRGNDVLGQIFGSKDVSRAVAMNAASQTGQDPSMLKKLLPVIAMVVSGYMAKQQSGQRLTSAKSDGGLGTLLGGLLGGGQAAGSSSDDLGGLLNMGSNKRNPLDDIVGSPRV